MSDVNEELERLEAELAARYPGSKRLRQEPVERAPVEVDDGAWDANPIKKLYRGELTHFFRIGAVCRALGRPHVTIRLWQRQGHLPKASFHTPKGGHRLYTRQQIEILIEVARRHGILDNPRVDWTEHKDFGQEVSDAWRAAGGGAPAQT